MNSVPLWVTVLGFAAPLIALAGSAVGYVIKIYQDRRHQRRDQFFELMQYIDSDRPIATKVAAIYQLRQFKEHREFIVRFCRPQRNNVQGGGAAVLIAELDATASAMENAPE